MNAHPHASDWPARNQARCLAELHRIATTGQESQATVIQEVQAFIAAEIEAAHRRAFEQAERMRLYRVPLTKRPAGEVAFLAMPERVHSKRG